MLCQCQRWGLLLFSRYTSSLQYKSKEINSDSLNHLKIAIGPHKRSVCGPTLILWLSAIWGDKRGKWFYVGHVNPESVVRQLTRLPNPPLPRGLCRSLGSYLVFAIFCFSLYFSALSMLEEPTKEPFYHENHSENQSHIQSWFSCSTITWECSS